MKIKFTYIGKNIMQICFFAVSSTFDLSANPDLLFPSLAKSSVGIANPFEKP